MSSNNQDKISVIIPIYKVEKYLRKCINSIIRQTYENMEIILVDDGSPDTCPQICDEYAQKYSNIIVVHKENGGLSDARNVGLDICTGKYIIFIDSDDYVTGDMCEKLYNAVIQEECDMAIGGYYQMNENGEIINTTEISYLKSGVITADVYFPYIEKDINYIVAWGKIYRKEIFNHIRYPKGYVHEDEFVIHHIVSKCKKIAVIEDKIYYYLKREGSITGKASVKNMKDAIKALADRTEFYMNKKETNCYINDVTKRMHMIYLDAYIKNKLNRAELRDISYMVNKERKKVFKHLDKKEKIKYILKKIYDYYFKIRTLF